MHAEVATDESGEPDDVLIADRVAVCAELVEPGVHVDGAPQHDAVEHQSERAGLHAGR